MSSPTQEINFFDPATNACPYDAYATLREEAPVWKDPVTGIFMLTRYDDIRRALIDTETFTNRIGNAAGNSEKAVDPGDHEKAAQLREAAATEERIVGLYEEKGWVPVPTLDAKDEPEHMQLRRLFDHAFRPAKVKELDPLVEELAYRLMDECLATERCEWVSQFAIPLPLYVIGIQVGVPEEDMPRIKAWTDAWVQRLGLAQSADQRIWSVEMEIEAQNYFQPIYDRLRSEPDDSFLSVLVNQEIPEWGRTLTDAELHSEIMADVFVGGTETTTNALSAGVMLLVRHPEVWEQLTSDPDRYLPSFVEEVLRVESPVQGLLREVSADVELHGVTIPAGSPVMLRYGAANRDEERFACPADIDLERKQPRTHLAFGTGTHHCLGAPLARRELFYGFKALVDRVEAVAFVEGANDFAYQPNYFLRALEGLHVELTPRR